MKYETLKNIASAASMIASRPAIGGYVALGTISDDHTDYHLFLGLYDTERQAQAAAEAHGTLPRAQAFEAAKPHPGLSWSANHDGRVFPVTKALRAQLDQGKANHLLESPEYFMADSVQIDGRAVASTFREANTFTDRLRDEFRDHKDRIRAAQEWKQLSPAAAALVAFSAAAAVACSRARGLAVFIHQAAKGISHILNAGRSHGVDRRSASPSPQPRL